MPAGDLGGVSAVAGTGAVALGAAVAAFMALTCACRSSLF